MFTKHLYVLLIPFLIVLSSCQRNEQNSMDQQRKAAYAEVNRIIDAGEVDQLDRYIIENPIDHQLDPSLTDKTGLAGIKEMLSKYHKALPDMKSTIHSVAISGDTLFGFITTTGTTAEPFMGIPANQKVTMSSVDIVRFEGGKMAEHWGFMDMSDVMKMMPQPNMSDESMKKK